MREALESMKAVAAEDAAAKLALAQVGTGRQKAAGLSPLLLPS